jgi:hypothetical protein
MSIHFSERSTLSLFRRASSIGLQQISRKSSHSNINPSFQFIETNKTEHLKLEKASMPLLYTMFNEYYDPMRYIQREEKIRLIENYWQQIGMLHRGYLTVQAFPDLDDSRIVLASGIYMDTKNMRAFVKDVTSPDKIDEYIRSVAFHFNEFFLFRMRAPIIQAMGRFIRKYKEQQIRIIDTAALICTALWADG